MGHLPEDCTVQTGNSVTGRHVVEIKKAHSGTSIHYSNLSWQHVSMIEIFMLAFFVHVFM